MQKIKKHHYGFISRQNGTGQVKCDIKKKCYHSDPFQQDLELRIPKKSQKSAKKKKLSKLRNIIVASFQAKIGWGRLRVIRKRKKLSFRFILTQSGLGNSQKIAKNAKI